MSRKPQAVNVGKEGNKTTNRGLFISMIRLSRVSLIALVCVLFVGTSSLSWSRGIAGHAAPPLAVDEWVSLPAGSKAPQLKDWEGKVVYLYFFQSWCPGCHSRGFPTLQAVQKHYAEDKGVKFAAVQTVFEGFRTNDRKAAQAIVKKYGLQSIPVAQSGTKGEFSKVMLAYQTGGTPWTVIIDKSGTVVLNDFHVDKEKAIGLIQQLKAAR